MEEGEQRSEIINEPSSQEKYKVIRLPGHKAMWMGCGRAEV